MDEVTFVSDYDPNTKLSVIRTVDGDIVLKIHGPGEMRIATNGGKLHGERLASVCSAFNTILEAFKAVSAMQVTHRGITAQQSDYNHHIILFKNSRAVMTINQDIPVTEKTLKHIIDKYIDVLAPI